MNVKNIKFLSRLTKAKSEEDVKAAFIKHFELENATLGRVDLRVDKVAFEFKYHENTASTYKAKLISQMLYYLRSIKYSDSVDQSIPKYICIADRSCGGVCESHEFVELYSSDSYDWKRAACNPDPILVTAVENSDACKAMVIYDFYDEAELEVFDAKLRSAIDDTVLCTDKKIVTGTNFEKVFIHWKNVIGVHINVKQLGQYFIEDLKSNTMYLESTGKLVYVIDKGKEEFNIPSDTYKNFWAIYNRPPSAFDISIITTRVDRLNTIDKRRFSGQFYTPLEYAKLGLEYIEKYIDPKYYENYYIWDMAAGTGNLEYYIPDYSKVFMSTLESDEVNYLNDMFHGAAGIFQYDFLNDDVELQYSGADLLDDKAGWKLPRKLREIIANPNSKIIVLINPPYAEATNRTGKDTKGGVAKNYMKEICNVKKYGRASNEIMTQFILRVRDMIPQSNICTYSGAKLFVAESTKKFRTDFKHKQIGGFIFPSWEFAGTKSNWPVCFTLWVPGISNATSYLCDTYESDKTGVPERVGSKIFTDLNITDYLSKWIDKAKATKECIPLKSGLVAADARGAVKNSESSIGYINFNSNDVQQSISGVFILSSTFHHGFDIVPDNFNKVMLGFTARRTIEPRWTNNSDQFSKPNRPVSDEFQNDALAYTLFHSKNGACSLQDLEYNNKKWNVYNHFFPFTLDTLRHFNITQLEIATEMRNAKDTYVATKLKDLTLSTEAQNVLNAGKEVYKVFFENFNKLDRNKYKLGKSWNYGWYQIRMALKDAKLGIPEVIKLKEAHKILENKCREFVYDYGMFEREEVYTKPMED
jgi:hypothetical protein